MLRNDLVRIGGAIHDRAHIGSTRRRAHVAPDDHAGPKLPRESGGSLHGARRSIGTIQQVAYAKVANDLDTPPVAQCIGHVACDTGAGQVGGKRPVFDDLHQWQYRIPGGIGFDST